MTETTSLWNARVRETLPALEQDLGVDVLIIGGGITGATAALELSRTRLKVALVEARSIGAGVTGSTTAHVTVAVDPRYAQLRKKLGADAARLVAASSSMAVEHVALTVDRLGIDCDLARVPGYLYSDRRGDRDLLLAELEAARAAGLDVDLVDEVPLPFRTSGGVRYAHQLRFHPLRYVDGVLDAARAAGVRVYENTRVTKIEDGAVVQVTTARGDTIRAEAVFCATHVPLNELLVHSKIGHYQSYAAAFTDVPLGDALFWDTADPYHYVRKATVDGRDYVIIGGEDHKTGEEPNTEACYARLLAYAAERFDAGPPAYRWSSQVIEPIDGLPFIGRNAGEKNVYVATGYSGNGMTYGTIAGIVVSDLIRGVENEYAHLYRATRVKANALGAFVEENAAIAKHLVVDRLRAPEARSTADIARGEGRTMKIGGKHLAVYRDPTGQLHALSGVCTHMGCILHFNGAERSWDCGCHGSRFDVDGKILEGPAVRPLRAVALVSDAGVAETLAQPT